MLVPVLPSNASPLRSGSAFDSRVLQEHSGNRQQADLPYALKHELAESKYATSLSTENSYPAPRVVALSSYPQREVTLNHRPRGFGTRFYEGSKPRQDKDAEAKWLYRRFLSSEQYAKYRGRQHKEDKPKSEQKWPNHMEEAFFRALVEWPPIGRRKIMWKDKQRGRNELIADYIESITGDLRTRKQVSSHIQVLKPFVENDPAIMLYLSKEDLSSRDQGGHRGYLSGFTNGRGLSRYPVRAPPQHNRDPVHQPVRSRDQGMRDLKLDEEVFELAEFEMFVQRKYNQAESPRDERTDRIHTYTKQISRPWSEAERYLDWEGVTSAYPLISAMNSNRPIDCNVIAAKASLFINPGGGFHDSEGNPVSSEGAELGISFRCRSKGLPEGAVVQSYNSFYQGSDLTDSAKTDVQINEGEEHTEMQIMFGSTFWVRALSNSFRNAGAAGAAFIQSITATQEIFAVTGSCKERILLIHWNFRLSKGPVGLACWKRVYLPSPQHHEHLIVPESEHTDAKFNFNDPIPILNTPLPALQSPFKYESSSGSALSTSTWPTSISDDSHTGLTQDTGNFSIDDSFGFISGAINSAYDPHLSLEGFDTSTFNFDPSAAEFVPDPSLHDFSQPWPETYASAFDDGSQGFGHESSFVTEAGMDSQVNPAYDPQMYALGHETQAYGGAGQDGTKEEDALGALTDVSYLAQYLAHTVEARLGSG